jgi:SAGA-associated factor 29
MKLSRENVKLCEDIAQALAGSSENDMNSILGSLKILGALRASSEQDSHAAPPLRAATATKPSRNTKRKADSSSVLSAEDRESIGADSPAAGPSPKVLVPSATRLKVHVSSSRAGSVPAMREASVKIEEGTESGVDKRAHSDLPRSLRIC